MNLCKLRLCLNVFAPCSVTFGGGVVLLGVLERSTGRWGKKRVLDVWMAACVCMLMHEYI